jgi:hypothetical protein
LFSNQIGRSFIRYIACRSDTAIAWSAAIGSAVFGAKPSASLAEAASPRTACLVPSSPTKPSVAVQTISSPPPL